MLLKEFDLIFRNLRVLSRHLTNPKHNECRITVTYGALTTKSVTSCWSFSRHVNWPATSTSMRRAPHVWKPRAFPGWNPWVARTECAVRFELYVSNTISNQRFTTGATETNRKETFIVIGYDVFPPHFIRLVTRKAQSQQSACESEQKNFM